MSAIPPSLSSRGGGDPRSSASVSHHVRLHDDQQPASPVPRRSSVGTATASSEMGEAAGGAVELQPLNNMGEEDSAATESVSQQRPRVLDLDTPSLGGGSSSRGGSAVRIGRLGPGLDGIAAAERAVSAREESSVDK